MPETGKCNICTRHAIIKYDVCKRCRMTSDYSTICEEEEELH